MKICGEMLAECFLDHLASHSCNPPFFACFRRMVGSPFLHCCTAGHINPGQWTALCLPVSAVSCCCCFHPPLDGLLVVESLVLTVIYDLQICQKDDKSGMEQSAHGPLTAQQGRQDLCFTRSRRAAKLSFKPSHHCQL